MSGTQGGIVVSSVTVTELEQDRRELRQLRLRSSPAVKTLGGMEAVIAELHALADVVTEGELGGLLFPAFVKHFRQTNGREPADAVWDVVRQVQAGSENLRPADVRRLLLKKVDELSGM